MLYNKKNEVRNKFCQQHWYSWTNMFYKKTIGNFAISSSVNSFITPPPKKKENKTQKKTKQNKSQ